MLSRLRHLLIDSWLGRILVGLIFLVFISWGAETIIDTWSHRDGNIVAWVGDQRVTIQELDLAAKTSLATYMNQKQISDPSQISGEVKGALIKSALQQLIIENNLVDTAEKAGLSVSDEALRNLIHSFPDFQQNGKFSIELFNAYVRQQNITDVFYLNDLRKKLLISGLINPVVSGATASDLMTNSIFGFRNETRQVNYIQVPFSQFTPAATPSDAILTRYYDNHLWEFTVPEYRRIKLIFITPETVAKSIEISDENALKYYNSRKQEFSKPETRNLEVLVVKDQKEAENLAAAWKMETWENIQKQAQKANVPALSLNDFTLKSSPSPELADAVQKTALNTVSAPVKFSMGWYVFKVTAFTPAHQVVFDTVKDKLKAELAGAQANQAFVSNIKAIQDTLAGGTGLDDESVKLLGGKGIVAVQGTLNEQGLNLEGQPAPIPSEEKVKQSMLSNIFSTAKNAPVSLIQGDNNIYYAFVVEDIQPAHQETFEQAKNRVIKAWQQANIRKQANIVVTSIFKQAQDSKKSVQTLGTQQFPAKESEAFSRINPSKILPVDLQAQAFSMQMGQTTMLEAPEGFYVATLNNITKPEAKDDPAAYAALKDTLKQADNNDIYNSYVIFINNNSKVEVNQKIVDSMIKQGSN